MRAQVSMEYLVIVGFAFMVTIPLIVLFYTESNSLNDEVSSSQIEKVALEIVDAADQVYYLGAPSKKTVKLYFPQGIDSVECAGKTLKFTMDSSHGDYDMARWSAGNISCTGMGNPYPGTHNVEIRAQYYPIEGYTLIHVSD